MNDTSNPGVGTNTGMGTNPSPVVENTPTNINQISGQVSAPVSVAPIVQPVSAPVTPTAPVSVAPAPAPVQVQAPMPAPAPVAPTPAVQPMPVAPTSEPVPATSVAVPAEKTSTTVSDGALAIPQEEVSKTVKKENSDATSEEIEAKGNRSLPIAFLIMFVVLLTIFIIYYFVVMKAERVFEKAINNAVDSVVSVLTNLKEGNTKTMGLTFNIDMKTEDKKIQYLNGLEVDAEADVDVRNVKLALDLVGKISDPVTKKKKEKINISGYYNEGLVSVSNPDLDDLLENENAAVEFELPTDINLDLNHDRIQTAIDLFQDTKQRILDIITEDELKRTIAVTEVENRIGEEVSKQSAIALKVTCNLDNQRVGEIYHKIFSDWEKGTAKDSKKQSIIKLIADTFGITEDEAMEYIKKFNDRDVVTKYIYIDLYMNLANSQLISLEVTVDNYFVKISNLNGIYYVEIQTGEGVHVEEDAVPVLNVNFNYDNNQGILKGTGTIDNDNTFLLVDFKYVRDEDETTKKKVGNNLTLNFYRGKDIEDKKNVIALLDCELGIRPNDNIEQIEKTIPNIYTFEKIEEEFGAGKRKLAEKGVDTNSEELFHYVNYMIKWLLYNKLSNQQILDLAAAGKLSMIGEITSVEDIEPLDKEYWVDVEEAEISEKKYATDEEIESAVKDYCSSDGKSSKTYTGTLENACTNVELNSLGLEINSTYNTKWSCCTEESTPDEPEENQTTTVEVTEVTLKADKSTVTYGDTAPKLTATCKTSDGTNKCTFTYKSSNTKVATVDNKGTIKLLNADGKTTITVTAGGKSATTSITVKKKVEEDKVDPAVEQAITEEASEIIREFVMENYTGDPSFDKTLCDFAYKTAHDIAKSKGLSETHCVNAGNKAKTNDELIGYLYNGKCS